jgi:hypothetical protein
MRIAWFHCVLAAMWPGLLTTTSRGQDAQQGSTQDARFEWLKRRLEDMERKHEADLKSRDEEIARLRSQLDARRTTTAVSPNEVERARADVLKDIEAREVGPFTLRNPVNFNPNFAVIVDTVGTYSPDRSNDAYNRFDVREAELDLRAAIEPRADGVLILAFERDVENPIFPEADGEEEAEVENSVNIEEAYALFHDFGVPNLQAKLGRFHVRFGRQNLLHLHDLPTTDPPFVNQAFLAPEALSDAGVSFSYVVPPEMILGEYVELIGEILMAEGGEVESPVFTGGLAVDSPATNLHILWNRDLGNALNFELGGSWLHGHRDPDNRLDADLFGLDFTLIRTDPTGGFHNTIVQAETLYGDVDQPGGSTEHAFGVYLLGQQQLNKDFYAGLRLDWTENPNDDALEAWGITPYVSWYWSEFLRFRASYQHRDGDRPEEDIVYLQCTFIFGAHPPHPYWAMR